MRVEKTGFEYFIDEETLRDYQKKSLELRLKWLYYGNKFRQQYPREVIEKQEKLRGAQEQVSDIVSIKGSGIPDPEVPAPFCLQ